MSNDDAGRKKEKKHKKKNSKDFPLIDAVKSSSKSNRLKIIFWACWTVMMHFQYVLKVPLFIF